MPKTNRVKITQRIIDSLKSVRKETWMMDSEVKGLGIRRRPNVEPVWSLRYKLPSTGQDRKHTIGEVGKVTLDYARRIAQQKLGELMSRGDIRNPRLEEKYRMTVSDLIDEIADTMKEKNSPTYVRDFRHQCRDYVDPTVGKSLVRDVTQSEVDRLLMKLRSKPYLHNRVRSNLNKIFNVAIRQGLRMDNPAFGSEKSPEEARDRVLDDGEVSRLLEALDAAPGREADLIRLLYLTGSRPKELLSARWSDFILETSPDLPSIWEKPALTVKQRRKHKVELSDLAAATFKRMRDSHNDDIAKKKYKDGWVFPSRRGDDKHLTTYKKFWSKVATVAGLEDARTYDLRKSFASRILASGANIGTAMQLTGHTQAAIFLKHYVKPMQGKQTEALARVQWVPLPK